MSNSSKLLQAVYNGIHEKGGKNVLNIDFSKIGSSVADYFVICDAQSDRQVNAIADAVEEFAYKEAGEKIIYKEGTDNAQWILLDYTDVVVHIFQSEYRPFYNLEALWADAEFTEIEPPKSPLYNLKQSN